MRETHGLHLVWLLLVGLVAPAMAASPSELAGLAGVQTVRVVVEDVNPDLERVGVTKEGIQARTAQRLSAAGLAVLPPEQPGAVPVVYIRLSAAEYSARAGGLVSFHLTAHVKQLMTWDFARPGVVPMVAGFPAPRLLVTTWESGTIVLADAGDLRFYVNQVLGNLMAELTSDWRLANTR